MSEILEFWGCQWFQKLPVSEQPSKGIVAVFLSRLGSTDPSHEECPTGRLRITMVHSQRQASLVMKYWWLAAEPWLAAQKGVSSFPHVSGQRWRRLKTWQGFFAPPGQVTLKGSREISTGSSQFRRIFEVSRISSFPTFHFLKLDCFDFTILPRNFKFCSALDKYDLVWRTYIKFPKLEPYSSSKKISLND